jgi:hypothetical protein
MRGLWYNCVGFVPLPIDNEGAMELNVATKEHLVKKHMIVHCEVF